MRCGLRIILHIAHDVGDVKECTRARCTLVTEIHARARHRQLMDENTILSWLGDPSSEPEQQKIGTQIYTLCFELFRSIIQGRHDSDFGDQDYLRFDRQVQRFVLWGNNFDALDGGLDERRVGISPLQGALFPVLCQIGEALISCATIYHVKNDFSKETLKIKRLRSEIAEDSIVKGVPEVPDQPDEAILAYLSNLCLTSSAPEEDNALEIEDVSSQGSSDNGDVIDEIGSCNDYLFKHADALYEILYETAGLAGSEAESESCRETLSEVNPQFDASEVPRRLEDDPDSGNPAFPYILIVLQAYPNIDKTLARRLGEANALRYRRLLQQRNHAASSDTSQTEDDPITGFARAPEQNPLPTPDISEGLSSALAPSVSTTTTSTVPSTKQSTTFSKPERTYKPSANSQRKAGGGREVETEVSIPPRVRPGVAYSVTSFATSVEDEITQSHARRLPKMPSDCPWGQPFECTVCGDILDNVTSTAMWR